MPTLVTDIEVASKFYLTVTKFERLGLRAKALVSHYFLAFLGAAFLAGAAVFFFLAPGRLTGTP